MEVKGGLVGISDIDMASEQRKKTIEATSEEHRHALSQHLTPKETALTAIAMFSPTEEPIACLDLGAGTGMLSVALIERYGRKIMRIDCIESDPVLAQICEQVMGNIEHRIIIADALTSTPDAKYHRIILNPPYKKMSAKDPRQQNLPIPAANLYSAFLEIALARLADDGEAVAIIPRSWTNGKYFADFRKWALSQYSLDAMHIYDSRSEIFQDTDVLQETMIIRFSKRIQSPMIKVSRSADKSSRITAIDYPCSDLIAGEDRIVRIAPSAIRLEHTVTECGYCPSTGKVVDFRALDRIYGSKEEAIADADSPDAIYPLIYVGNMREGKMQHPADIGKPQWFRADDGKSVKQLLPAGAYVLVRRFSAKEEPKRVVAYPVELKKPIALENHMSFIHSGSPQNVVPLPDLTLAKGLAMWLNSTYIDDWFRGMSGSTQVNAKDVKAMPCPEEPALLSLGMNWADGITQEKIDALIEEAGIGSQQ